jgi:hypothetical protein
MFMAISMAVTTSHLIGRTLRRGTDVDADTEADDIVNSLFLFFHLEVVPIVTGK